MIAKENILSKVHPLAIQRISFQMNWKKFINIEIGGKDNKLLLEIKQ